MLRRQGFQVAGRVQGVGFRWFTVQAAERCDVVGWVKNRRDGSVCGEAQGSPAALVDLMDELRQGPGFSSVDEIVVEELPVRVGAEAERSFEIR